MAGLVPAIHALPFCDAVKTRMPGTKPHEEILTR